MEVTLIFRLIEILWQSDFQFLTMKCNNPSATMFNSYT